MISTIPVDASGNSLAGETEAQQEAVYAATDLTSMDLQRFADDNIFIEDGGPDWGRTILNAPWPSLNDLTVAIALSYYLSATGSTLPPDGSNITLIVEPGLGGDPAKYVVVCAVSHTPVKRLVLTFVVATRNGYPCDRYGNPIQYPNTAAIGGGKADPAGGPTTSTSIDVSGDNNCWTDTTVDWGDGTTSYESHFNPCQP